MAEDPFAAFRPLLLAEARRVIEAQSFSHAAVLHQQLERYQAEEASASAALLLAPSLCLLTGETLGAPLEAALSPAASLLFLGLVADVFLDLREPAASNALEQAWGMPRALNAGDAFFVLAQDALLQPSRAGLDLEQRMAALGLLDGAARQVSETLADAELPDTLMEIQRVLLPFAVDLGAVAARASGAARDALRVLGEYLRRSPADEDDEPAAAERDSVREYLQRAANYVAGVSQQ